MHKNFFQKGINLLLARQTNILSAAFVIMATVILSQVLGLIRQRLLVAIFGASQTGLYLASSRFPDSLFQIIIAGAISSAFIPVFSEFLGKHEEKEAHQMASAILTIGCGVFLVLAVPFSLFAPFFLQILNVGKGFTPDQIEVMVNLTRIIVAGQLVFIVGSFFAALLQSYNHFFIPGFAAALYNLGIIVGILFLHQTFGIYAPAYGVILGALFFIFFQLPTVRSVGFAWRPSLSLKIRGVMDVVHLMWPRTLSNAMFQIGSILILGLISFLPESSRNYTILDYAQTLAFAPIALFGQTIAQAAFPVLSKQRENLTEFRTTFITSFTQVLYLVLPISMLLLVLRIPVVRLVFGAGLFSWEDTVLTGKTLAFFAIAIFAQALLYLVSRGFYALRDAKTPLIAGSFSTLLMLALGWFFVVKSSMGVGSIAVAYSIAGIVNLVILMIVLDRKVGGFARMPLFLTLVKIFSATIFSGFALYIPIKLLDQLVFDTTLTINLLILTGISSMAGLLFYLFLTWLFNVKEASIFLLVFKKIGNWKETLGLTQETIQPNRMNP